MYTAICNALLLVLATAAVAAPRAELALGGPGSHCVGANGFFEVASLTVADEALYIADGRGNAICRVDGIETERRAGTGQPGPAGDGGPALEAKLSYPADVAIGPDGTEYWSDSNAHRIRARRPDGIVVTIAGDTYFNPLAYPMGLSISPIDGALYVADAGSSRILKIALPCAAPPCAAVPAVGSGTWGFAGDNGPALAAQMRGPRDVAFEGATLYIADSDNHRIRRVAGGVITTIAGITGGGFAGDDGPATAARLSQPWAIAVRDGRICIADVNNNRVRCITDGTITTVLGTGLTNTAQVFTPDARQLPISLPKAVAFDDVTGDLYVGSENDHVVYRVELDAAVPTVTRIAATTTATQTAIASSSATRTSSPTLTRTATSSSPSTATRTTETASATWSATRAPPTITGTRTPTLTPPPSATLAATATPAPTNTPAPPILICDVTGIGGISSVDATRILQAVAGTVLLDRRQELAADATGNGTISAVDATRVLQFVAGLRPPAVPASRCGERVGG